ncbi:ISAs1 family transposase [Tannerella forsythia]|uniref:ISAs1 family transposase n=1 Tax=Tannerella forsythia TaxID=28112 RepID=A0A3P1YMT4_TANFO|nr:ISAs1 family transposase [Tannerella forsythia]RRD71857.1 ISAs1 family transposase [Tannerella forsythia]
MYQLLLDPLFLVEDPCLERKKIYSRDFLFLIVFLSSLSGCSFWYETEDYAHEYEEELMRIYKDISSQRFAYTMPLHDMLNRSLSLLNVEMFEEARQCWLDCYITVISGQNICIDGKTMRSVKKLFFDLRSHFVSAYSPQDMCSFSQLYLNRKGDENKSVKKFLEFPDLENGIVSIDGIGARTSIVEQIVDNGGDYALCVKANQGLSSQETESCFCLIFEKPIKTEEWTELFHGRIEIRRDKNIVNLLDTLPSEILSRWQGLRSIHRVLRKKTDKKSGKAGHEIAYYISSMEDLTTLRQVIRGHWAIENNLHHSLDVYLGHDAFRKRSRRMAQMMDIIQKINVFFIQRLKTGTKSSILRIQKKITCFPPQQILTLEL